MGAAGQPRRKRIGQRPAIPTWASDGRSLLFANSREVELFAGGARRSRAPGCTPSLPCEFYEVRGECAFLAGYSVWVAGSFVEFSFPIFVVRPAVPPTLRPCS